MRKTWVAPAVLLLVVLAILAVPVGVGATAVRAAEERLQNEGLAWEGRELSMGRAVWTGIHGPALRIERLELGADRNLFAKGITLELQNAELRERLLARVVSQGGAGGAGAIRRLVVEDVDIVWEETVLADWSGEVRPTLDLDGAEGWIRGTDLGPDVYLKKTIDLGHVGGDVELRVDSVQAPGKVDLKVRSFWIFHELLGATPLEVSELDLDLEVKGADLVVEGSWGQGTVHVDAVGFFSEPRAIQASIDRLPFAELVGWFADRVPEARRADVDGLVGLRAEVVLDPFSWKVEPVLVALKAADVIRDVDALRSGRVAWTRDGHALRTRTAQIPWTDLENAGWLKTIVLAAEDARFYQHPGYDTEQIRDALQTWSTEGGELRGGSTITQQLAKNLYTGDDRTLVRKLRELLHALDLEHALGKDAILELYLNVVELGPDIYGIRQGAQTYFSKTPAGLSPKEAAFLAALLPSPRRGYENATRGRIPEARIETIFDNLRYVVPMSPGDLEVARRSPVRLLVAP